MTNGGNLVPCPYCHREMVILVRATESRLGSTVRRWSAVGEAAASLGGNGQSFEFSTASLPINGAPMGSKGSPSLSLPQSLGPGALSPGEKRTSKEYREHSFSDILTPLAYAGISGAFIGLASIPICVWLRWPWYVAPITWMAATAGTWFIAGRSFLDDDKLLVRVDEQERTPPPAPIVTQPPATNVEINERDENGRIAKQIRATLYAPASNPDGLWRYCQALAGEGAFPSWEGGASAPGARDFGYTGSEFEDWRREAERAKLLEPRPGRNQGYQITERGYAAFERIAAREMEEASYGIS